MKRIVLLCAAGMSTSMLVMKMQEAAEKEGLDYSIDAYSATEAGLRGKEADIVLLGPQIRYSLESIQKECPHCPVEVIDMQTYGLMDGKKLIAQVKEMLGE